MANIERHALVVMNKKKSTIKYAVYAYGTAQLSLYALRNLKGSEYAFIVKLTDGSIAYEFFGNKDGFPKREQFDASIRVADITLQELIREDPMNERGEE